MRWFSCGPTWTDGVEEDTSFKPSSTFLMLNFFIFRLQNTELKSPAIIMILKKDKGNGHFISLTHTRALCSPCGSYILVLIIYRSLHAGKLNARTAQVRSPLEVFLERGRWGCWCVGVICSLESVLCPTASPFFLSASLPSPLDCVRRSAKAETQRGGGGGDAAAAAAADALAHV